MKLILLFIFSEFCRYKTEVAGELRQKIQHYQFFWNIKSHNYQVTISLLHFQVLTSSTTHIFFKYVVNARYYCFVAFAYIIKDLNENEIVSNKLVNNCDWSELWHVLISNGTQ